MAWTLTSASDLVAAPGEAFLLGTFLKPELFKHLDIMLWRSKHVELVSYSLPSRPALCLAVEHGHTKMVQLLLERSSSILHILLLLVIAGLVISGGFD